MRRRAAVEILVLGGAAFAEAACGTGPSTAPATPTVTVTPNPLGTAVSDLGQRVDGIENRLRPSPSPIHLSGTPPFNTEERAVYSSWAQEVHDVMVNSLPYSLTSRFNSYDPYTSALANIEGFVTNRFSTPVNSRNVVEYDQALYEALRGRTNLGNGEVTYRFADVRFIFDNPLLRTFMGREAFLTVGISTNHNKIDGALEGFKVSLTPERYRIAEYITPDQQEAALRRLFNITEVESNAVTTQEPTRDLSSRNKTTTLKGIGLNYRPMVATLDMAGHATYAVDLTRFAIPRYNDNTPSPAADVALDD